MKHRCGVGMALAMVVAAGLVGQAQDPAPGALYTSCNLWYENPAKMSCVNYQVGAFIPAGSEVRNVAVESGRRSGIAFTVAATGVAHRIEFSTKYFPGKTVEAYRDQLFTAKPLAELTAKFTDQEKECVRTGSVVAGISKEAVLVAYGLPPEHQTPQLSAAVWHYWSNRFIRKAVLFDQDGKVASVNSAH